MYENSATKRTYDKQGHFVFDSDTEGDQNLPMLGPFEFENSAIYTGQWKYG